MKFGVVNKSTTVNRFLLHTIQRNITHLAVITRQTNKTLKGETGKEQKKLFKKCSDGILHVRNVKICSPVHADTF